MTRNQIPTSHHVNRYSNMVPTQHVVPSTQARLHVVAPRITCYGPPLPLNASPAITLRWNTYATQWTLIRPQLMCFLHTETQELL